MNTIFDLLSRPAADLALDIAAKSTLVLAVAGVAALMLRRAPAATRHLAWCLGLVGGLAMPVMALCVPGWTWPVLPPHEIGADIAPAASIPRPLPPERESQDATAAQPLDFSIAASTPLRFPSIAADPGPIATAPEPMAPTRAWTLSPWNSLSAAWSTVAMLILSVPMVGRFALWRLALGARSIEGSDWNELLRDLAARLGLSRRVTLLRSQHTLMPMTWGWLRPIILLPDDADSWPVGRRRDVLLHELAHIKRLDCLTQAVAQLACALYWFNPLAWIASRRLRIEREHACDDMVLLAGSRASDYAEHLLDLARPLRSRHRHSFAALAMARPSHLEGRLISILDAGCPRRGLNRPSVVIGLIAMAGIILPLAIVRLGVRTAEAGTAAREAQARPATARQGEAPAEPQRTVDGRVIDEQGKPIAGSQVALLSDRKKRVSDQGDAHRNQLMGTATTDADGRFRVAFSPIPGTQLTGLRAIAAAPGKGFDGNDLKADVANQETTITLDPERVVEGRLVDVQGQAAARVRVRIRDLNIRWRGYQPYDSKGGQSLWPSPATTDRDGRFRLLGLGDRASIAIEVDDPRFARQSLRIEAGDKDQPRSNTKAMTIVPAQAIEVRLVRDDDGKPMAGGWVNIQANGANHLPTGEIAGGRTDDQGRVRIVPWSGDWFTIFAYSREGEPYLPRRASLNWPKGAVQRSTELKLKRGVVVRGTLTEEPSGSPVAGAWITYYQKYRDNPRRLSMPDIYAVSRPDGSFTMVLPHGPGHLLVRGPSADYLHVSTSWGEMGSGIRPSFRMYPDAMTGLDIKPEETTHDVSMRLRRGVTVQGRVIGPDGKPIAEAFAIGRSYSPYEEQRFPFVSFNGGAPRIEVRDGRIEIPGCDPEKPSTFYFLDVKNQLGATVEVSGKLAAGGPITVRLQKCASARVRYKDPDGKPVANHPADDSGMLTLIITPGPEFGGPEHQSNIDLTTSDDEYQVNLDRDRDRNLHSGPDGSVTLVSLIPGATYRFRGREFTTEPSKTIDLPDVTVGSRK